MTADWPHVAAGTATFVGGMYGRAILTTARRGRRAL